MKSLAFVLLFASTATAAGLAPVPNNPLATGDQVWIISNGVVKAKLTDASFIDGSYARVGTLDIGSTFCQPQPQPQPFAPPPFTPETPELPDVLDVPAGGPDLLSILMTVGGGVLGWYIGRKYADDDQEVDAVEKEAVA